MVFIIPSFMIFTILILFIFFQDTQPIRVFVTPPSVNDFNGDFYEECGFPCDWVNETFRIDAVFNIANKQEEILAAKENSIYSPINILGSQNACLIHEMFSFVKKNFHSLSSSSLKSEIPWLSESILKFNFLKYLKIPSVKKYSRALFIANNCHSKFDINNILAILSQFIPIVSKCFNNTKGPFECDVKNCSKYHQTLIADYKFYFVFEKSNCPGDITETILLAYEAGTLPVYFGSDEIDFILPHYSYVNAADFKSYEELGIFLQSLLDNERLYKSYFIWKKSEIFDAKFPIRFQSIKNSRIQCRVCMFIVAKKFSQDWNQDLQTKIYSSNEINIKKFINGDKIKIDMDSRNYFNNHILYTETEELFLYNVFFETKFVFVLFLICITFCFYIYKIFIHK